MCVLPVEPMCHTYALYFFPFVTKLSSSQLWIPISQLAVPRCLFVVRHYLSLIEVDVLLKGMTFEKWKPQECYFCSIFKETSQPFTVLWLDIKWFIMPNHLWYSGLLQLSIFSVFMHPFHLYVICTHTLVWMIPQHWETWVICLNKMNRYKCTLKNKLCWAQFR